MALGKGFKTIGSDTRIIHDTTESWRYGPTSPQFMILLANW
jgi:hypothetical protein